MADSSWLKGSLFVIRNSVFVSHGTISSSTHKPTAVSGQRSTVNHQLNKEKKELFVGVDLHKRRWHVTVRDADVELFSGGVPGTWESVQIKRSKWIRCVEHWSTDLRKKK